MSGEVKNETKALGLLASVEFKDTFIATADNVYKEFLSKPYEDKTFEKINNGFNKERDAGKIIPGLLKDGNAYVEVMENKSGETKDSKTIKVQRPNHGLATTIRVSAGHLPEVIDLFADASEDLGLKRFCTQIRSNPNLKLRPLLQTVMLYAVVKRQSEVGFEDNATLYKQYRKESAQEFRKYCQKEKISEDVIKLLEHPLEHMGAPAEEYKPDSSLPGDSPQIQRYLQKIFTLSHELDLLRVVPQTEWREKIGGRLIDADIPGDQLGRRVNYFQTLVSSLLIGMGDRCGLDNHRETQFRPPFAELSTEVGKCLSKIRSIKEQVRYQETPRGPEPQSQQSQPVQQTTAAKVRDVAVLGAAGSTILGALTVIPLLSVPAWRKLALEEHLEEFKMAAEVYGGVIGALLVIAFIAHVYASRQVTPPSVPASSKGNGVDFFGKKTETNDGEADRFADRLAVKTNNDEIQNKVEKKKEVTKEPSRFDNR